MKTIKLHSYLLTLLVLFISCACKSERKEEYPIFTSKWTVEDHIKRLTRRTEQKFANALHDGVLLGFDIEIIYSFYTQDPEYFLIEFEYAEKWKQRGTCIIGIPPEEREEIVYETNHRHLLGMIVNDEYKAVVKGYDDISSYQGGFRDGKSIYSLCGYENYKKFYAPGILGVEINGEIFQCFTVNANEKGYEAPLFIPYCVGVKELSPENPQRKMIALSLDNQKSLLINSRYNYEYLTFYKEY